MCDAITKMCNLKTTSLDVAKDDGFKFSNMLKEILMNSVDTARGLQLQK